jgi:hypothetical protein
VVQSYDETQVFKNLRPPVSEKLILFNVFEKVLVTNVQLKILAIIKSH